MQTRALGLVIPLCVIGVAALQGCADGEPAPFATGGTSTGGGAGGSSSGPRPPGAMGGNDTAGASGATSRPSAACAEPSSGAVRLQLTPVVTEGLTRPTYVSAAPGDATRLFVLEQGGAIRVVRGGVLLEEPFLDLGDVVNESEEQGLLGLAFHPTYAESGRFFVHYSSQPVPEAGVGSDAGVTSEFRRDGANPERADRGSERRLVIADQPASNHNGGMLAFGPRDGMLYIARGNGGTGDSQDLSTLLGKILRIDVDREDGGRPYAIPAGNLQRPGALPEIWSYGLRNPWRFSFDPCSGDMYIADVGEREIEEIDHEPANTPGRNYGWSVLEGSRPRDSDEGDDIRGLTLPVAEYEHGVADSEERPSCSVTGGYVYRGASIPALRGAYLYADYCSGRFWSLRMRDGVSAGVEDITAELNPGTADDRLTGITSFGTDAAGELYVLTRRGGLYRIDAE